MPLNVCAGRGIASLPILFCAAHCVLRLWLENIPSLALFKAKHCVVMGMELVIKQYFLISG
jgi:hypothetical protein